MLRLEFLTIFSWMFGSEVSFLSKNLLLQRAGMVANHLIMTNAGLADLTVV